MKDSFFAWTIKQHKPGRRRLAERIARNPHLRVVHLRSQRDVEAFLQAARDGDL